jgi:hypothetical protein
MALDAQAALYKNEMRRQQLEWLAEEYPATVRALVDVIESAIASGDWKVDGACDPDGALSRARRLLRYEA